MRLALADAEGNAHGQSEGLNRLHVPHSADTHALLHTEAGCMNEESKGIPDENCIAAREDSLGLTARAAVHEPVLIAPLVPMVSSITHLHAQDQSP